MWARLLLCFFVVAVGASAEQGWKSGNQYDYTVRARTLVALNDVADLYNGVLLRAKLRIQPENDDNDTLNVRVTQAEQADVHQRLPGGWDSPIDETSLTFQPLTLTDEPFQIKLRNGVFSKLILSSKVPQAEANIIKSLASQLQVNTKGENQSRGSNNNLPTEHNPNGVYEVMEDGVTGKCRVQYDVSELPRFLLQSRPEIAPMPRLVADGHFIDIVKTTNFSHCENRPEFHFGVDGFHRWTPVSAKMGQFFSRSSVSRIVLSGNVNKYTIQSSVTTNKAILSPELYNAQKGMVVSWMNLTLVAVEPAQAAPQQLPETVEHQDLSYRYESVMPAQGSQHQRKARMIKDEDDSSVEITANSPFAPRSAESRQRERSDESSIEKTSAVPELDQNIDLRLHPYYFGTRYASKQKIVSLVTSYTRQIAEELQKPSEIPSKTTLAKFTLVTSLVRSLDQADLSALSKELYPKMAESERSPVDTWAWKIYRDAVAEAGTGPALLTIKQWISEDLVKDQEAGDLLQTLSKSALLPSKQYLKAFFELVTSRKVKQQQYLNATAAMSFAELVRLSNVDDEAAHNRYPAHIYNTDSQDIQAVTREYIPYFKNALQKAVQMKDSHRIQTYIRVLGKFGHPLIVEVFEPYLSGKVRVTKFQRLTMVVAMGHVAEVAPEIARAALLKIYQNVADVPQVRAAAVVMIMKCNPSASVLQRMAESAKDEQNPHVRAVVYSAIESAAKLQSWDDWELTSHAKAAQSMLNSSDINARHSQFFMESYDVTTDTPLSYSASFINIGSQDSFYPQGALLSLRQSFGDFKLNPEGAGYMTSSIGEIFRTIGNKFRDPRSWTQTNASPFRSSFGWSIQDVLSELNITRDESEPIEANALFKTLAGKRFFNLDNQTIQQLPYELQKAAEELREGKHFNYTKLYDQYSVSMSFPTATGSLFFYSLSTPTLLSLGGRTRVIMNPQPSAEKLVVPETLNATFEIHAVASTKIQAEIGFIDALNANRYTAGVDKHMQMNLPLQAHVDVEIQKRSEKNHFMEIRAKVRPTESEENFQIATIRSRPFTAKQNVRQPAPLNQRVIHIRNPYETNFTFGQQLTGMAFRVDAATEQKFPDFASVYQHVKKNDFVSLWAFLTKEQSIFNYEYTLSYDHQKSTAKSVTFTAAVETLTKKQFDEKDSYLREAQQQQEQTEIRPQMVSAVYMLRRIETESDDEAPQATPTRPSNNLAKPSDTSANSHERRKEFLKKSSQHINDADAIVIDLSATFKGKTRAEFVATAAQAMSEVSSNQRTLIYLRKKSADQQEKQLALAAEFTIPKVPLANFAAAAKSNPDILIKTAVSYGQELDSSASQIDVSARLHRTKGQVEHVRRSPMGKLCVEQMHKSDFFLPACQNATITINKLNSYDVTVAYERVSEEFQNVTYKAYSLARDFGWQFNSESVIGVNNGENKIVFKARFDREYEAVNVSIAAPRFNSYFENIRLNRKVAAAIVAHPTSRPSQMLFRELYQRDAFPICTVAQTAVNTFSNKTYPMNLGKNWHVVFTTAYKKGSASEKSNDLVILARETDSSEHHKEVVILAGRNVIELTYARDFARANVNGNTIRVSDSRTNSFSNQHYGTWAIIYGRPDGSVKIVLPQYQSKILYDRFSLIINAGGQFRDQVRGLCGLFDGQEASDFTSPRNCVLKEAKDFAASYIFRPTGSAVNDQENAKNAQCLSRHYSFGDLRFHSEEKYGERQNAPSAGCVDFKVKMIENDGQTCFSKYPQPTCNSQCQPENETEKSVDFACVPQPEATEWQRHVRMSSSIPAHLARSATTKKITMKVPESCQP